MLSGIVCGGLSSAFTQYSFFCSSIGFVLGVGANKAYSYYAKSDRNNLWDIRDQRAVDVLATLKANL